MMVLNLSLSNATHTPHDVPFCVHLIAWRRQSYCTQMSIDAICCCSITACNLSETIMGWRFERRRKKCSYTHATHMYARCARCVLRCTSVNLNCMFNITYIHMPSHANRHCWDGFGGVLFCASLMLRRPHFDRVMVEFNAM